MNARAIPTPFEIDVAPAMRLYMDGLENWKESCQRLIQATTPAMAANLSDPAAAPQQRDAIPADWYSAGSRWMHYIAEQQAELCRFYGTRWERYVELSDRLARCHSPAEVGEAQLDFISRMASDYMQQGAKAAQPLGDLLNSIAPRLPR